MAYLIDADWTIDHLGATAEATSLMAELAPSGSAISIITYLEVYQGIARSPTPLMRGRVSVPLCASPRY